MDINGRMSPESIRMQAESMKDNASSASNSFRDGLEAMHNMAMDGLGMALNIGSVLLKVVGTVSGG